jgi:predicted phosphoribosyltransferase
MIFEDRAHAARLLAERLKHLRGERPIVLAIPRGAVPMAGILADALGGEMDVVLVHKLRSPINPELAIGSVDETGHVYLDPRMRELWTPAFLEAEKRTQLELLARRRQLYSRARPPHEVRGRVAIVVDDGVATGSTMIAALRAVRARSPARLIAAVGVAPPETLERLRLEADEVVSLLAPPDLDAVGRYFRDFGEVTDDDVVSMLEVTEVK